jgi:S-adenosylmethionine:tRNA ribosyltransferase-isomerase
MGGAIMSPATRPPEPRDAIRLLALDPRDGTRSDEVFTSLPNMLRPGDLLVVNDAATLPASLRGQAPDRSLVELRLLGPPDGERWRAVVLGEGSWRQRTEDRPPPPDLAIGDRVDLGNLVAEIRGHDALSTRLVDVVFEHDHASLLEALYRVGRSVQYAHLEDELDLWSVQTLFATRPWAAEMPSAGRPLTWRILSALRERGVALATLTHAAGLSATGDAAIDAALPLPERYEIPARTVEAIGEAKRRGARVVAVGTTVTRALEGAAASTEGVLRPGPGVTDLVLDASFEPRIVDGLLTGMHEPTESHHRLLQAFVDRPILERTLAHAVESGYRTHEFGDCTLVLASD